MLTVTLFEGSVASPTNVESSTLVAPTATSVTSLPLPTALVVAPGATTQQTLFANVADNCTGAMPNMHYTVSSLTVDVVGLH
jgi:hypothetical protein